MWFKCGFAIDNTSNWISWNRYVVLYDNANSSDRRKSWKSGKDGEKISAVISWRDLSIFLQTVWILQTKITNLCGCPMGYRWAIARVLPQLRTWLIFFARRCRPTSTSLRKWVKPDRQLLPVVATELLTYTLGGFSTTSETTTAVTFFDRSLMSTLRTWHGTTDTVPLSSWLVGGDWLPSIWHFPIHIGFLI